MGYSAGGYGGNSGPLPEEIDWETVTKESGSNTSICERPLNTGKVHRVAWFNKEIVCLAIRETNPTKIVLNMIDYIDAKCKDRIITTKAKKFIAKTEKEIGREVNYIGYAKDGVTSKGGLYGRNERSGDRSLVY